MLSAHGWQALLPIEIFQFCDVVHRHTVLAAAGSEITPYNPQRVALIISPSQETMEIIVVAGRLVGVSGPGGICLRQAGTTVLVLSIWTHGAIAQAAWNGFPVLAGSQATTIECNAERLNLDGWPCPRTCQPAPSVRLRVTGRRTLPAPGRFRRAECYLRRLYPALAGQLTNEPTFTV